MILNMKKLAIVLAIIYFISISGSVVCSKISEDMIDYIKSGNMEKLEQKLQKGTNLDEIYVALCSAVYKENVSAVKTILKYTDVDALSAKGYTPLILAIKVGNEEIVSLLIDAGVDINDKDIFKESTIQTALSGHKYSIALMLIERGADLSIANFAFALVRSEMVKADKDIIEKLVKIAADNTDLDKADNIKTFFGAAVYTKNYRLLDFLNEKYKDINYLNSAFKHSLINSDTKMADYIYQKGGIIGDEENVLGIIYLLDNCDTDTIKHVVDNYDKSDDKIALGVIDRAILTKRLEVAEYVLKKGIYVNKLNNIEGDSPMFTAIRIGDADAVKLLLDYSVPVNVTNMNGKDVFEALEETKNTVDWFDFGNKKKLDDIYKMLKNDQ